MKSFFFLKWAEDIRDLGDPISRFCGKGVGGGILGARRSVTLMLSLR